MALGRRTTFASTALAAFAAFALSACSGGGDGNAGPVGPVGPPGPDAPPPPLEEYDPLPGVNVEILSVTGGTGAGGNLLPGDTATVQFTVKDDAGNELDVSTFTSGQAYLSGPTQNYQRVIKAQTNVVATAAYAGSGVWSYTFPVPVPSVYEAPYNDTAAFGLGDGEWTGQTLVDGTYTVGLQLYKTYTIESVDYRDAGAATSDVLLGGATTVTPRETVLVENCNDCHTEVRAHGGTRVGNVTLCLLCHTTGSEDRNDDPTTMAFENWTPGVTVDFKVMVHKIHNASHLPSVLGVSTNANGSRNYAATPVPLEYVGFNNTVVDLSDVVFPVWPSFNISMPRDFGYSALPSGDRSKETTMLRGVVACAKCHGGAAQEDLYKSQPSRAVCGSCHDDIDWTQTYSSNQSSMPPQADDNWCFVCHTADGPSLPTSASHRHPLSDPSFNAGVVTTVTQINGSPVPASPPNLAAGSTVTARITVKDNDGNDVPLHLMDSASAFFFGPSPNRQVIYPYPTSSGLTPNPFDFSGRLQAVSTTNKGSMTKVFQTGAATKEVVVVELTSATAFDVRGQTTGALGTGTLAASASTNPSGSSLANFDLGAGLAAGSYQVVFTSPTQFDVKDPGNVTIGSGTLPAAASSVRFVSANLSFNVTVGTTAAAAGNTFYLTVFKSSLPAQNLMFAIVVGRTAFSATANARDRFYYEIVPAAPAYDVVIPMDLPTEFLGDSTASVGQVLATPANQPFAYGRQQLWEAATTGAAFTVPVGGVAALAREMSITGAAAGFFAAGDPVVFEPSAALGVREYVAVTPVNAGGNAVATSDDVGTPYDDRVATKLFFRTPLRYAHAGGVTMKKVALTLRLDNGLAGANGWYAVNASGTVTSTLAFTAGPVNGDPVGLVMSYRAAAAFGWRRHNGDALQAYYMAPINGTAARGQEQGSWPGLSFLSGTYTIDLWCYKNLDLPLYGEVQTFRSTSTATESNFLFNSAGPVVPHQLISDDANCYKCHDDVLFHGGGRRGLDACLTCHGISGGQTSQLASGGAIEFRQLLHEIHAEEENTVFPAWPGGVKQCVKCHGNDVWTNPSPRVHPSATKPTRVYGVVCGACHESVAAQAHIDINTPGGVEGCDVCHGPGKPEAIENVHISR